MFQQKTATDIALELLETAFTVGDKDLQNTVLQEIETNLEKLDINSPSFIQGMINATKNSNTILKAKSILVTIGKTGNIASATRVVYGLLNAAVTYAATSKTAYTESCMAALRNLITIRPELADADLYKKATAELEDIEYKLPEELSAFKQAFTKASISRLKKKLDEEQKPTPSSGPAYAR